jgi:cytochrome c oxidase assembly protein subunit 15
MVVVGGITRLTLSGLSITEWQPVVGILPPVSAADWAAEFAKYQQIPEYRLVHFTMTLDEFKSIYWWEYAHRLLGRLIGVAFAGPFVWFLARRRLSRPMVPWLAGILLLGFAQGALGWYMVESGLADRVEVSQYRLVAHLALALAIYAAILWVALGIVRGSVQFDHRLLAVATAVVILLVWAAGRRAVLPRPARAALHGLVAIALLQVALGITTLVLVDPIPLAATHQAGAVLLLTAAVVFRHTLRGVAPMDEKAPAPI